MTAQDLPAIGCNGFGRLRLYHLPMNLCATLAFQQVLFNPRNTFWTACPSMYNGSKSAIIPQSIFIRFHPFPKFEFGPVVRHTSPVIRFSKEPPDQAERKLPEHTERKDFLVRLLHRM